MAFSVVLDTCVLYPTYLRDTLLRLAEAQLYRPLWSRHILEELERSLMEVTEPTKAERVIALMRVHFEDAEVRGYEELVSVLRNDPKDRHVLAAAVRSNAAAIVTFNLTDFPAHSTDPFSVDVIHPDAFLLDQLALAPGPVVAVLTQQARAHLRPPREVASLLAALEKCGAPEFAAEARRHLPPGGPGDRH